MKHRVFLLGLFLVSVLALTGCSAAQPDLSGDSENVFPGQFLLGDVYILQSGERINGDIAGIDTQLTISERAIVNGSISAIGSQVRIDGIINGNINSFGGSVTFGDTAQIRGDINNITSEIDIAPGAGIVGEINAFSLPEEGQPENLEIPDQAKEILNPRGWVIFQVVRVSLLLIANTLIIFLFKDPTLRVVRQLRSQVLVSWIVGIVLAFSTPLVAIVLLVSICLSPIGLLLLILLFLVKIWSWTLISYLVGDLLASWLNLEWGHIAIVVLGSLIVGLVTILLSFIPFVGIIINAIVSALGVGSIVLGRFGIPPKSKTVNK